MNKLEVTLPEFKYRFNSGPVDLTRLDSLDKTGNCRLAIQLYFHTIFKRFFHPNEILCPNSFYNTGIVIELDFKNCDWKKNLKVGDVIFAERISDKDGVAIDRSLDFFKNDTDEYIISLHSAVIYSENPLTIWHATTLTGGTCFWSLEHFEKFYRVIRVKRFV